jgi:hypothetical protein
MRDFGRILYVLQLVCLVLDEVNLHDILKMKEGVYNVGHNDLKQVLFRPA